MTKELMKRDDDPRYLDEVGMISFRRLQPVLVEDVYDFVAKRTVALMASLGATTDDISYIRAHMMAVLYRVADALPGELCDIRAHAYKAKKVRERMDEATPDARVTYAKLVGKE